MNPWVSSAGNCLGVLAVLSVFITTYCFKSLEQRCYPCYYYNYNANLTLITVPIGWEQEKILGPLAIFPKKTKMGFLPPPRVKEGVPPLPSLKDKTPMPHNSLWKNGVTAEMGLYMKYATVSLCILKLFFLAPLLHVWGKLVA